MPTFSHPLPYIHTYARTCIHTYIHTYIHTIHSKCRRFPIHCHTTCQQTSKFSNAGQKSINSQHDMPWKAAMYAYIHVHTHKHIGGKVLLSGIVQFILSLITWPCVLSITRFGGCTLCVCVCVCLYVCMYVVGYDMCVCVYIYIYTYTYICMCIFIHIHVFVYLMHI